MLIESEQPVFAVVWNTINQLSETLNKLIVRAWLVSGGGGTHVHLEFESMKRVSPRSHLRIHKSAAAVCAAFELCLFGRVTGATRTPQQAIDYVPIVARDHRLLPQVGATEQRGWLKAVVDIGGLDLSFWVTHLDSSSTNAERLICVTNFNS